MTQYIPKSALVAEIKKLKAELPKNRGYKRNAYNHVLRIIDSFEVKEVDLKLAYHDFLESHKTTGYMLFEVAEYFFELGLKAQKGE